MVRKGIDPDLFRQKKFLYAVRKCTITYKAPARYGDTIICDANLLRITAAQLFFKQTIRDKATGRLVLEAEITLVSLNKDFKPTPIPEEIRSLLS